MNPTDDQLRVAVCEAMGWTDDCPHCGRRGYVDEIGHDPDCRGECQNCPVPIQEQCPMCAGSGKIDFPPLTLDRMWQAEETLTPAEIREYVSALHVELEIAWGVERWAKFTNRSIDYACAHATAVQRARAFLKAKGIKVQIGG